MENENVNVIDTTTTAAPEPVAEPEQTTAAEPVAPAAPVAEAKPTPAEVKRIDFSKRFKPCSLIMFFAHGHRVNDYKVTEREVLVTEEGAEVSSWRTVKTVLDPENSKKAMSLRGKFMGEVIKLGAQYGSEKIVFVDFERADDVEALKVRWAAEVKAFNASSPIVKINFGLLPPLNLTGENEYLLGNLLDELKSTMVEMKEALENADYESVRKVATRLKGFVTLVPDQQASQIVAAIADARKQARQIKAKLEKKGEQIAKVQEMISTAQVDLAVAACIGEDLPLVDGPSTTDLMEAQAREFCAAIQDDGQVDEGEDEDAVDEDEAPVEAAPVVVDEAPQVDDEPVGPVGYTPPALDTLAALAADQGPYWV
jgi:hypothetical protein